MSTERSRFSDDRGVAMIHVLGLAMVVMLIGFLLAELSVHQAQQAGFQTREDVTLAGTEAMLERYASKLTLDPLYYLHRVDEAERARVCSKTGHASIGQVVEPGNTWWETCTEWTYQDPNPDDWFVHPLFDYDGDPSVIGPDDIGSLMEVTTPVNGRALTISVVGRRGDSINRRLVSATINAVALSEFARVTADDLSFGSGADILGPMYSGGDLDLANDTDVYFHIYAEDDVTGGNPARYYNGAKKHDSNYPVGHDQHIRTPFPDPLNFDNFWDDLETIRNVACTGPGYCLDDSDATAWLVHPYVAGGVGKVRIWKTTYSPGTSGCVNSTEYWFFHGESAMANDGRSGGSWTSQASFTNNTRWSEWSPTGVGPYDLPLPAAGVIWANQHVVFGLRGTMGGIGYGSDTDGDGFREVNVKGALTVVPGSAASPKYLVLNADVNLDGDVDVLGLAATHTVAYNPFAVRYRRDRRNDDTDGLSRTGRGRAGLELRGRGLRDERKPPHSQQLRARLLWFARIGSLRRDVRPLRQAATTTSIPASNSSALPSIRS